MSEKCIMPESSLYSTERKEGLHRHEVFYGSLYRKRSIEDGLVVFLKPEMHNMSNEGVHFNKVFDLHLKRIGQQTAMKHYGWNIQDFIHKVRKKLFIERILNNESIQRI